MPEIYVCDDNEMDRARLIQYLRGYFRKYFIHAQFREFSDGTALLEAAEAAQNPPALIYLDIYMEEMDGVEIAGKIREKDAFVPIIFITSSDRHGVEAFRVFADGYLKKPYTKEELFQATGPFKKYLYPDCRMLELKPRRGKWQIPLYEILYLESEGHTTVVHTVEETFQCSRELKSIREELADERGMMECGKSYLVNLHRVKGWDKNRILMENGSEVYMPLRLAAELKRYMKEYYHDFNFDAPV